MEARVGRAIGVLYGTGGVTAAGLFDVKLDAGREYALVCDFTDQRGAPEHTTLGMFGSIVVPKKTQPLAIVHVGVVDVAGGKVAHDQSVLIDGSRITIVGSSASVKLPAGSRTVDGRGRFLIPGLWDMHGHLFENSSRGGADEVALAFPAYLANGVTGVRDMWTTLEGLAKVREWNASERAGMLEGPRIIGTSTMISGPGAGESNTIVVTTAARGRQVVDSLIDGGAKTIKVQNNLSRESYFAIAAEARQRHVPFVGHVTGTVTAREAADSGQLTIEHLLAIPDGCSAQEAEVMRRRGDPATPRGSMAQFVFDTYDDSTCAALARHLAARGTWVVPTSVVKTFNFPDDSLRTGHRGIEYAPADRRATWPRAPQLDSARLAFARANFARTLHIIGILQHNGVGLLAGTDITNPWLEYGFSLQDELALMTDAGLTPAEALRTATTNPARFFAASDTIGAVAKGQVADLVLLDANPLLDIHNTRRIRAVVAGGRLYDRVALDSMLARAKRAAAVMK